MEETIETAISNLVHLIETKYITTANHYRPLDFSEKAQFFTLDVISSLAFDKAFGFLEQDEDVHDYIRLTSIVIPVMLVLSDVGPLRRLLFSPLLRWTLPKETDKSGFGALLGSVIHFETNHGHFSSLRRATRPNPRLALPTST